MNVLKKFLYSRKFWVAVAGFVTLLGTSLEDGALTSEETMALAGIIIGYVFSVAFEDGMTNRVNLTGVVESTSPTTIETVTAIPETGTTVETVIVDKPGD